MDCSFLTADSVRADLRITARVSTGAGADRGRSMNIYYKTNIFFGHISLLNSINTGFTPFKTLSGMSLFLSLQLPDQANTHTHTHK